MRDNSDTLNAAVTIASREQNLQKRFQLQLNQSKNEQVVSGNQGQMPMAVDHARNKGECHYCKKRRHHIKDCRKRLQQLQSVSFNEAKAKQSRRRDQITCFKCGKLGHYADECAKYDKESLNSEPSGM